MMAQTLIHRAADKLQPFITKFLNDLLVEGKSSETDLSSRAYELIFELNFVNASLLLYVLPQLDNQLKVEDLETRSSAVQLLARMFAAKDSTLPSSYPHLFSAFLGRFKDINPDIRIVMVQFAEHFIINQADDKLLSSVTGMTTLYTGPIRALLTAVRTSRAQSQDRGPEGRSACSCSHLTRQCHSLHEHHACRYRAHWSQQLVDRSHSRRHSATARS